MPQRWLLGRLDAETEQPKPEFALAGTLNWLRALAISSKTDVFTEDKLRDGYATVQRRSPAQPRNDTLAYEYLLLALHNLAPLSTLRRVQGVSPYDGIRVAIISWYYVVYEAASAMVLAASGDSAEEHRSTDRIFHSQIIGPGHARGPFAMHVNTVVQKDADSEIDAMRGANTFNVSRRPTNQTEATGALLGYLKGTAAYERERLEPRVRESREFKALCVGAFRKKAARDLRDAQFARAHVNFLTQAFRYRGKANYHDSIYLTYGDDMTPQITQLWEDLELVAQTFFRMATHFIRRRVERDTWTAFVSDVQRNARCSIAPGVLTDG